MPENPLKEVLQAQAQWLRLKIYNYLYIALSASLKLISLLHFLQRRIISPPAIVGFPIVSVNILKHSGHLRGLLNP
jgi:hypothetical protein